MSAIHLIVVGKLKDKHLETIEGDYVKRIRAPKFFIHEVKASAENKTQEAETIRKKVKDIEAKSSGSYLCLLSEWGEEKTSVDFSKWLFRLIESEQKTPIFVIGGAEGFCDSLIQESQARFSLSKLTYPHKLARILFIEQVYRAITIKEGHPYHN
jgi:23S rRNA (pseudouridine1915-N3)-methyltransferase